MGNILREMGELDGAKECFQKVLSISPDYSWAYYNLASIAFEEEDYESVALNLDKTIELNPKDEQAYINYAKILAKMGLFEDAKNMLMYAINECPDIGNLYYYIAQIAKYEGNKASYIENLNNALQNRGTLTINPDRIMNEIEKAS